VTALAVLSGVALAFAGAAWLYRTRELPVRGRSIFALLRGATLAALVVLLWNPPLPGGTERAGPPVLIADASPSMRAGSGDTPAQRVRELAGSFDGVVEEVPGSLVDAAARAAEAGSDRVVIATDLRGGDGVSIRALAAESSVPVEVVDVGGPLDNAGISDVGVPERARPGDEVVVTVRVHATSDGLREIVLRVEGDTVARAPVQPAEPGTERPVELSFTVPELATDAPPRLVVEATLDGGDDFADDDLRAAVLDLDDPGGGIVAVSWSPDWELRTLVPLLDEVSGLRARAYHALGDDRWLLASGSPAVVDGVAVRAALSRAEMVVLHAAPEADTGLVALARTVPRRLELAASPPTSPAASPPQSGEWFVAADVPPSPIAAELAGLELLGLPPLSAVRTGVPGTGTPIQLQRGGSGTPVPAFDLRRGDGERVVTARAEGFWRWALRAGDARELYRRLWSGLAAWALTADGSTRTAGFGPAVGEVRPGEAVRVLVGEDPRGDRPPALDRAGDPVSGGTPEPGSSRAVEISWTDRSTGAGLRTDTIPAAAGPVVSVPGFDDRIVADWTARVLGVDPEEGAATPTATGTLLVQPRGTELRPQRDVELVDDVSAILSSGRTVEAGGTPLRDTPWPWLLIVVLLSAEWVGRRRAGLR
jgi:hypothetical protein